jgi:uncharacterized protein (TIGR04255 family)
MKITNSERVIYEHNPIAEVICQIRFDALSEGEVEKFAFLQKSLSDLGYVKYSQEKTYGFQQQLDANGMPIPQAPVTLPQLLIHRSMSSDGLFHVLYCADFISISCLKYSSWDDFFKRIFAAISAFAALNIKVNVNRVGLRYRDVIEREAIGLKGIPWQELIKPFLLGPFAQKALCDEFDEDVNIHSLMSQSQFRVDDSWLILQSALMSSVSSENKAFLIDSDFFYDQNIDPDLMSSFDKLGFTLNKLHSNAGALFRRCITEKLHNALKSTAN